jgi:hypothetical protein
VATPSSTREEVLELEIQHGEKVNAMGQQVKWAKCTGTWTCAVRVVATGLFPQLWLAGAPQIQSC